MADYHSLCYDDLKKLHFHHRHHWMVLFVGYPQKMEYKALVQVQGLQLVVLLLARVLVLKLAQKLGPESMLVQMQKVRELRLLLEGVFV